ncbi:MAG: sel1 repeat family protein [Elusimicrobia bacterium]|nr:sel1 repeat family protein [Elusimicrobiota bacterium]
MSGTKEQTERCMRAAKEGDPKAQLMLGVLYDAGDGVPQNKAEAVRWYAKAAAAGNAKAQHNLAIMYHTGQGVKQNYQHAARWYKLAAARGVAQAQFNLGLLHLKGHGVDRDRAAALKWFLIACANPDAGVKLEKYAAARDEAMRGLSGEETERARAEAAAFAPPEEARPESFEKTADGAQAEKPAASTETADGQAAPNGESATANPEPENSADATEQPPH